MPVAAPSTAIRDALTPVRNALAGAGVPCSLDPADVPVPGAWLSARGIDSLTLAGDGRLTYHVWLVAPAVGAMEALDILTGLLQAAQPVVDLVTEDEPDAVDLAQSLILPANPTTPLPAFRLTGETEIEGILTR